MQSLRRVRALLMTRRSVDRSEYPSIMAAIFKGRFLFTCILVLGFLSCQSMTEASRLPSTAFRKSLREFKSDKPQIIRAELMHRDHQDSPLSPSGTTTAADWFASSATRQKSRRARRLTAVGFTNPISSGDIGEYVMTVYLGTPVRKFVAIIDTGSELVWVQCRPCNTPNMCFKQTNPYLDPSASSSYAAVPCTNSQCDVNQLGGGDASCDSNGNCHISYAYLQAGSGIAGKLSTETISLSNSTEGHLGISNFLFGCMNNDTASFGTVDGLVGFGRGAFSLPSQLSQLTSLNVYSYCLVPHAVSSTITSSVVFGVSSPKALQLVYTPILDNSDATFYWVNMTAISINGKDLNIPSALLEFNSSAANGGAIFDSETTAIELSLTIWTTVVEKLYGLITYPNVPDSNTTLCYNISGVRQPTFPSMTLHFSGMDGTIVDFPLTGQNLFLQSTDDVQCLAVNPLDNGNPAIIGNVAQADHYVETDLVNKRIGWTSRDCTIPM